MITPEYLKELSDEELLQYASRIEAVVSLAGDVAHGFNDILQAIRGYTELALIDTRETDKIYPRLKHIYKAVLSGSDITKRLLTIGKPFETEPEKRQVIKCVNKEILKAKKIIERALPERIKLTLDLDEDLYPVCIDPYHIEQILTHLSLNAIEAMAQGGTLNIKTGNVYLDDVFCSTHKYINPGRFIYIAVTDDGVGIPKQLIKHVFDPFFSTKSKKTKGSMLAVGLGLTIVDRIVKSYEGTAIIESPENKEGTRVLIYIPASEVCVCEKTLIGEEEDSILKIGTEDILIVDDSDYARDATIAMLEKFGYRVKGAGTIIEGLKSYTNKSIKPKLAIIDLVMPEISGKALLIKIKKKCKDNKVIITSGYDLNHSQRQELYNHGAAAILAKPYRTKKLLETVRKVLDG